MSTNDHARVRELLGREPQGRYEVVVRNEAGEPVVLRNAPLLDDGTPMPTRYWLVDPDEIRRIGRLESTGGVDDAEREIDPSELAAAHARYGAERDTAIPADHAGPRPTGGVAGTRTGVKCLHAHWAWHLAGGDDPVGRWIERRLATTTIAVADDQLVLALPGGGSTTIPWGPVNLTTAWIAEADPPHPASLTNALGAIDDHLDDVERLDPTTGRGPIDLTGPAVESLAMLELGTGDIPDRHLVDRAAAEEVFRLVATESSDQRGQNPGLPLDDVGTIVATCCITLAVMRHFRADHVTLVCRR